MLKEIWTYLICWNWNIVAVNPDKCESDHRCRCHAETKMVLVLAATFRYLVYSFTSGGIDGVWLSLLSLPYFTQSSYSPQDSHPQWTLAHRFFSTGFLLFIRKSCISTSGSWMGEVWNEGCFSLNLHSWNLFIGIISCYTHLHTRCVRFLSRQVHDWGSTIGPVCSFIEIAGRCWPLRGSNQSALRRK